MTKASENFYKYVNEEWLSLEENAIPADYSSWGGFVKLYDVGLNNQINIIKNLTTKKDLNDEEVKILAIWQACQQQFNTWYNDDIIDNNITPIKNELDILNQHFNNPNHDYITSLANYIYYTQINGISNVIDFDKGSDLSNSDHIVLDISITGLSLPSREYYKDEQMNEKLNYFKQHLNNVYNILCDNKDNALKIYN